MIARVKSLAMILCSVAVFGVHEAQAQNEPLKGKWVFTLDTVVGRLPIPMRFKTGGDGDAEMPNALPLVYRERGASFSISIEVAAEESPTGQPFTMLLRGSKSTDDAASGTLLIVTEVPDPSRPTGDPIKVVVGPGAFTAIRE